jgi:hypothetical protein
VLIGFTYGYADIPDGATRGGNVGLDVAADTNDARRVVVLALLSEVPRLSG